MKKNLTTSRQTLLTYTRYYKLHWLQASSRAKKTRTSGLPLVLISVWFLIHLRFLLGFPRLMIR